MHMTATSRQVHVRPCIAARAAPPHGCMAAHPAAGGHVPRHVGSAARIAVLYVHRGAAGGIGVRQTHRGPPRAEEGGRARRPQCPPRSALTDSAHVQATEYDGVTPSDPHIRIFWEVLEEFTQEERMEFGNFVCARSRLPTSADKFPMSFRITGAGACPCLVAATHPRGLLRPSAHRAVAAPSAQDRPQRAPSHQPDVLFLAQVRAQQCSRSLAATVRARC